MIGNDRRTPVMMRPILALHSGHMPTSGDQYRDAREGAGLTREQLVARVNLAGVNLSIKTVQRLESGENIRDRYRRAIEDALGLQPEDAEHAGPRGRSLAEFTNAEIIADVMRRLNEGERALRERPHRPADPYGHTDVEDAPDSAAGFTSSG
jgi:transcriptional regulator with XRE-family HTH domain